MLGAQLAVELVFDLGKVSVGLAGDNYCLGLVPGSVGLDEVLEGIVVDVICTREVSATGGSIPMDRRDETGKEAGHDGTGRRNELAGRITTYGGSILVLIPFRSSGRISLPVHHGRGKAR